LHFQLAYRVFGKGHAIFAGTAQTVNISSKGVLVTPIGAVSKGQLVELSIQWQTGAPGAAQADLEILGRVMRVDRSGTAIHILRYGFHPHSVLSSNASAV